MMMPWMFLLPLTLIPFYFPFYPVIVSLPVVFVGAHLAIAVSVMVSK